MDFVTARNLIIESSMMSRLVLWYFLRLQITMNIMDGKVRALQFFRFYTSFLRCLHLVLSDPKGALSGHVSIKEILILSS